MTTQTTMITVHVYPNRVTVLRVTASVSAAAWRDPFAAMRRDANYAAGMNWVIVASDDKVITPEIAAELGARLSAMADAGNAVQKCAFVIPGVGRPSRIEPRFAAAARHSIVARVFASEAAALAWVGWAPVSASHETGIGT